MASNKPVSMYNQALRLARRQVYKALRQAGYNPYLTARQVPSNFTLQWGKGYTITIAQGRVITNCKLASGGYLIVAKPYFTATKYSTTQKAKYHTLSTPIGAYTLGNICTYVVYRMLYFGQIPPALKLKCTPVKMQKARLAQQS